MNKEKSRDRIVILQQTKSKMMKQIKEECLLVNADSLTIESYNLLVQAFNELINYEYNTFLLEK